MEHLYFSQLLGGERSPLIVTKANLPTGYPEHCHDFNELVFIAQGAGYHVINGVEHPIQRGNICLIRGSDRHAFTRADTLQLYNFIMHPQDMDALLADLRTLPTYQYLFVIDPRERDKMQGSIGLCLPEDLSDDLSKHAELMVQECVTQRPGFQANMKGHFLQAMTRVCRGQFQTENSETYDVRRIGDALAYIEAHFVRELNLPELAGRCNVSLRHFQRLFHDLLGVSPMHYIIQLRLNRACRWLQNTDLTVTEIAFRCGFHDSNYFTRAFKARVGVSPGVYRRGQVKIDGL